ncbi:MAG: hypothetical protein HQ554_06640, partial [FCB group bacterium]|nr:hypothetical protein [FCB group bacterium]
MKKTNLVLGFMLIILFVTSLSLTAQNNALSFDGPNDYVTANGVATTLNSSTTLTMEAWFYCEDVSSVDDQMILAFNDATSGNISQLYIETGASELKYSGSSVATGSTLISDTWYHVAVTLDASNNLKVYLNGFEDISTTETDRPADGDRFLSDRNGTTRLPVIFLMEKLTKYVYWNDVRTLAEIRANMYQELVGNEAGLVVYYNSNAVSGTTLADNSSNSNTGTLTGMTGTEWITASAFFGPKNCLDFDGTDDYVSIPPNASLNNSLFTVEFWLKLDDTPSSWDGIIDKGRYSAGNEWYFVTIKNNLGGMFGILGVGEIWFGLNDNGWHHVAGTYDGTTMKVYVDGLLNSITLTGSYTPSTNAIRIGQTLSGQNPANITIDEIRIWNYARTSEQICENMCKSLTGTESGLVAYFNFDNTSGTVLQDLSPNANDGTLSNMDPASDWVTSTAFNTWLNTNSSSWSTATNWSLGSVPISTDNVGIYSYTGGTNAILTGTPTVNNMVIGGSSTITISSNATVNGNLILESNLDLNGQTITLGSSATLIEDAGYLYGATGTIQTTRGVANPDGENVGGLGVIITDTDRDLGSTTIIRGHESQGSNGINRYYQINPTSDPTDAILVFNYLDAELNGITEADLMLFKSDNGVDWIVQGSLLANNTLTLTGIDSFSWWTAGDGDAPLPVTLSSFYALYANNTPTLYWTTQSEENNAYWNVYRGTSDNFATSVNINANAPVPGNGTINSSSDYVYVDTMPVVQNATYWYWIEDVSTDGETVVHEPITLSIPFEDVPITPDTYGLQQNYPNPFNPSTSISFALAEESDVELIIYNIKGAKIRTIFNDHIYADQITSVIWDGNDATGKQVSSGVYFYKLITET